LQDKDNNGRHELKHDALASKIFEKITLVEKELLEIRQLIENSYHGWQKRGVLLSAEDLKYMAPYESRLFLPEDHKRFIEKSKSELTRARRRRRNIVSAASLLLIIILSALSIWAIKERKNAIEKEELANEERIKAEASEKEAVRARDMAIESDRRAVAAGNEALKARDAARASETRALYEKSIAEKRETEARANNFNFMSKEMVPQDPTVALRLALHSRALNPYNKSISDNLNRIYYDNSFYKVFLRYEPGNFFLISPDWAKIVTTNRRTGIITDLRGKDSYYLIGHLLRGFTTNVHKFARYGYDDILSIALSPDGKTVLTGSGDKTARLWDMKGNILQVFRGHISAVYTVAFSPDGQSILTGAGDFSAKLWNQGGNVIQTFTGHNNIVNTVAFSPDGRNVLTGSGDSTAILWDMKGNVIQKFTGHTGPVRKVAFFPGGKTIVTGANDHTARIWDLSGNILHVLTGHTDNIISLIISSDGKKIITGSSDKTVRVWDSEGNALQKFTGTGNANYIALSPDETKILTSSSIDGIVKEWDMTRDITKTFSGHKNLVYRVAFSPDGKTIITLSADGTIKLWDLDGDCLQTINTYSNDVVMSPDGKTLLTGFLAAQIFDLNGKAVKSFVGQARGIRSVAFSPDGKTILTGAADNTVRLWDLEARILQIFSGHTDIVSSVSFSPDGNTILTGSYDNSVRLWDLKGNLLNVLKGHTNGVEKAEFSQDGRTILSGSNDKTAILWDLKGDIIRVFSGHTGAVNSVCFSPDGKNIVTASSDRTVRIWDTDGNTLQIERGYKNSVYSVAFSPDGKTILTGSGDNTAKLIYLKKPLDRFLKDSDSEDLNIEQKLQYGIINASEAVNETDYNNLFAGLKFCLSQAALQNKSTPDYLNTANILFRKVSIYVTDPLYRKIFISCGIDLFRLSPKKSVSDKVKEANRLLISSKTRENLKEIYDFYSDKCSDLDSSGIVLGLPGHLIRLSREMLLTDTTTRYTVSNDLSGIVWPLIQFRQYGTALEAMDLALAADSTNQYAYTTLPLVLVLNNRFEKAAEIYKSYYKRFFFGYISWPFRQIYLEDLDELEKRHISHPDLRKVRELLKN
ncbi:MAG: hypothetical protein JXA55_09235, partial [Bacteroidales bacterium]|nr:hypothetical protein [Bacteroidales bacterium]